MLVKTTLSQWMNPPLFCAQNVCPAGRNRVLLPCPLLESMQPGEVSCVFFSCKQLLSTERLKITKILS